MRDWLKIIGNIAKIFFTIYYSLYIIVKGFSITLTIGYILILLIINKLVKLLKG